MTRGTVDERLLEWIERMSPAERIGQLFMVAPDPAETPEGVAEWLAYNHYGGLFLQWQHLGDRDWLLELTDRLAADVGEGDLPRLVATDEEGGLISDLAGLTSTGPSAAALALADNSRLTQAVARAMGHKLRVLGFNLVFAPVLDVNAEVRNPVIGTRAYGGTPQVVTKHALAAMAGFLEIGVAACGKHFPGHGATRLDSHLTLPEVDRSADHLRRLDLAPFRAAIDAGIPALMTAHVAYPALDPTAGPATLSPEVITGLLRAELGFQGLVISDSLEMEGVASSGDPGTIALQALEAGVDCLLYAQDRAMAEEAAHRLTEALRNGDLDEERLVESLLRIGRLRLALTVVSDPRAALTTEETLDLEYEPLLRRAARSGIRLVTPDTPDLPLRWKDKRGLWVLPNGAVPRLQVEEELLRDLIEPLGITLQTVALAPTEYERQGISRRAQESDYVIACTLNRGPLNADQRRLIDALATTHTPLILVSLLNPTDLDDFPSIPTRIATHGFGPLVLQALVAKLLAPPTPSHADEDDNSPDAPDDDPHSSILEN